MKTVTLYTDGGDMFWVAIDENDRVIGMALAEKEEA